MIRAGMIRLFSAAIQFYQLTLASFTQGVCRFEPSCSHYALDALRLHGPMKGLLLTSIRIARCHPFGGAGRDPVPQPRKE